MREIKSEIIEKIVSDMCMESNYFLPCDIKERINNAIDSEKSETGKNILKKLIENSDIAAKKEIPICQDTGMSVFFVEIGNEVHITGDTITEAINSGVKKGYEKGYLRKSIVSDPINRINTNDNTPAVIHYSFVKGDKVKITIVPKGFGSENMSRIKMFAPSDGIERIKEFVIDTVEKAGSNPCPPIVVGVGIGGNFESCAILSKKALARSCDISNENEYYKNLEEELLDKINKTGIGPQGFGGNVTALSVNIETAPTHIAGLPCAVNISCHASRHLTKII